MDVTPDLMPVLGELFGPLAALGSTPKRVASLLGGVGVRRGATVLDLACGKGAVAIELVSALGCRVVGVDGCAEFLQGAEIAATRRGVGKRCAWRLADLRAWAPRTRERFEVAMMIGLDSVGEAAPVLRRLTKAGGLYVMDDAVRDPGHRDARRFSDVPDAAELIRFIESLGDRVERRVLLPKGAVRARHATLLRGLGRSVAELSAAHPRLKRSLRAFLARQRDAIEALTGPLRPTLWVVRRGG